MATPDRSPVTRYLLRLLAPPAAGGLTDAQLLERFVARRDEAAFEVLLWRHGPKVLGVCRRVLRHEQDAEDAFQATFLILVRKAGSVGKRQALGSWLHRVAYRVALRAKTLAAKRAARQMPVADMAAADPEPDPVWGDLRPVLDEEVNRLPEKYRAPFVLCYLDGKTNAEAARELGCPKGTVLSRLAWARQRLRARLTRRGLAPAAGLVAAGLAAGPAEAAAVPAALVGSTLGAVLGVPAGPVAALTKGVLQTMLWNKCLIVAGCVLAAGGLAVGGARLARQTRGTLVTDGHPDRRPQTKAEQPADKGKASGPEEKTFEVQIRDQPWAKVLEWYSDISGLPFVGVSRPTGTVTFVPPKDKRRYTLGEITDLLNEILLAKKYILVRRAASFTVLPADEKVDPTLVPRVRPEDLAKRGKTELVTVVVPLTKLSAKDLAPEVKKIMGPFGEVVVLEKANRLVLQDTAGNLRHIYRVIQEIEAEKKEIPKKP
jgi:RNA polymerase sigma factor (sigma-70 family)